MPKQKYALVRNGSFVMDWNQSNQFVFTTDLDKARLYTEVGLKPLLSILEKNQIDLVCVEVKRIVLGSPFPSAKKVDERLALMQEEFALLDSQDIDELSEKDYKRWRRLKRCIAEREPDTADW